MPESAPLGEATTPDPRDAVRVGRWWEAAIVLPLAALEAWNTWNHVPGFTTDSDAYVDVADNLHHGLGLVQRAVDFTRPGLPDPLGMWPPFYPVAIAGAAVAGIPVALAARLVAAVAWAAFAALLFRLSTAVTSRRTVLLPICLLVMRPALMPLATTAWSEPLYLALLAWGVLVCVDLTPAGGRVDAGAVSGTGGIASSLARGLPLGAACLTRYVGIPIVLGLAALAWGGIIAVRPGLRRGAWTAGALVLPAVWVARNALVFGQALGPALPPSGRAWGAVLRDAASALRWEFAPHVLAPYAVMAIAFLVFCAGCIAVAGVRGGVGRVVAYLVIAHLALAVLASHASAIHELAGRYMAPVYAFAFVGVFAVVSNALVRIRHASARNFATVALIVAFVAWVTPIGDWAWMRRGDAARLDRAARVAELVALVDSAGGPVFSDDGQLVRVTHGRSAVEIPTPFYAGRAFTRADRARWEAQGAHEAVLTRGSFAAPAFADWVVVDSTARYVRLKPSAQP
jgi:hypothetical protein